MSWRKAKIGEIAEVKGGKRLPQGFDVQDEPTQHPYLRVVDFTENGVNTSTVKFISKEAHERIKRYTISDRDVYVSIAGTIGRVGMVPGELSGANLTENAAKITNLSETILPEFLLSFLRSTVGQQTMKSAAGGTSQPKLALFKIADIEVPLPDLPTQQRIAGILLAYDDLIENNRRRTLLLEQAARLLYREWFVHLRFPGHETAKIVDGLPEGWSRCAVEDLLVLQRGFDLPVGDRKEGDVPVYGSTGIVGHHNEPKVPAPAIITGRSGSLGQVAIIDTPCWPLNTALWVKELKGIPATLGYYLLVSLELEKYNGGASVPTLDRKVVHRLPAVRPPSDVAEQFDAIASKSFQTIAKLKTHNLKLTRARDLLLPRLMDGRIPV